MSNPSTNFIDLFTTWFDKIKDFMQNPAESTRNLVFDFLFKRGGKTKEKAEKIREEAEQERSSLFGEVSESILNRYFPNISKILDIQSNLTENADPELVSWQNEFEALTALTMFIPDFLLRFITDPLAKSKTFLTIVENWPLGGKKWADKIRKNKNPDDVISFIRIMHQDMISGKVSSGEIIVWLK